MNVTFSDKSVLQSGERIIELGCQGILYVSGSGGVKEELGVID